MRALFQSCQATIWSSHLNFYTLVYILCLISWTFCSSILVFCFKPPGKRENSLRIFCILIIGCKTGPKKPADYFVTKNAWIWHLTWQIMLKKIDLPNFATIVLYVSYITMLVHAAEKGQNGLCTLLQNLLRGSKLQTPRVSITDRSTRHDYEEELAIIFKLVLT